jgi:hypothetical protein
MTTVISGLYKRPYRDASSLIVEVSANIAVKDNRGKNVPYVVGVRKDDGAPGMFGAYRLNAFISLVTAETDAEPMSLDGWYLIPPADGGEWYGFVEHLTNPDVIAHAVSKGARPLADYAVKA